MFPLYDDLSRLYAYTERELELELQVSALKRGEKPSKELNHADQSEIIRLYDDPTRLYAYSEHELALKFQVSIHPLIVY